MQENTLVAAGVEEEDELYPYCVQFAAQFPNVDAELLSRAFSIGRRRAAKLVAAMKRRGDA